MTAGHHKEDRRLGAFFGLTVVLTLPAYALIAMVTQGVFLTPDQGYAFVPLATLAPLVAATVLIYRAEGWAGLKSFFLRAVDIRRITGKRTYATILFLPVVLMLAGVALAFGFGFDRLPASYSLLAAPVIFIGLFGGALSEELGWMGFAYDRMRNRWSPIIVAFSLGTFIALWHLPLYVFLIDDTVLLTAQVLFPLALRLLTVWLYTNSGNSILAATVFHTLFNVCYAVLAVNLGMTTGLCLLAGIALLSIRPFAPTPDRN